MNRLISHELKSNNTELRIGGGYTKYMCKALKIKHVKLQAPLFLSVLETNEDNGDSTSYTRSKYRAYFAPVLYFYPVVIIKQTAETPWVHKSHSEVDKLFTLRLNICI